jgi:hypothetical protein
VNKKNKSKVRFNDNNQESVIKRKLREFRENDNDGAQIEDKQNDLEFYDDEYEMGTERNNFYNLDTDRGMISKRGRRKNKDGDGDLELKKLNTKHSNKRSYDTRATENALNIPDLPDDDDSLVEDEESSIFDNSF